MTPPVPRFTDPSYLTKPGSEIFFIFACMFTQLYYQAAQTNVLSIMKVIREHYDASTDEQNWFMAAVPLATGTLVLISGRMGDVYGLKKMMICGYIWGVLWDLLSGIAYYSDVRFFIVARAFMGAGIAFIIPNMMGIAGTVYTPQTQRKNTVFALIGACAPIGAVMGALWSGIIAEYTPRWDWTSYAHTLGLALAGVISYFIVPDNLPVNVRKVKMDWGGSFLAIVGLVLFNFVWNEAPSAGFDKAYIIVLLCISVVALVAFAIWEDRVATYPLIPHSLKKSNRLIVVIITAMWFGWGSFGVYLLNYFRFLLEFKGYGPLHAGWTIWPFAVSGVVAAACVGTLFRVVRVEVIFLASMMAFTLPNILLATAPVDQTYWRNLFGASLVVCYGMDLSYPAASIVLSDSLPPDCQGMAGSLTNTIVGYSTSIFLGFGAFLESRLLINGQTPLKAFRGSLYFAIGLGGFAILIAALPLVLLAFGIETPVNLPTPQESINEGSTKAPGSDIEKDFVANSGQVSSSTTHNQTASAARSSISVSSLSSLSSGEL